jgi:uncharacterized protein YndB with AHSA1/START domain
MTAITESVEIGRSPEDVFVYLDDLSRHGEWQEQIVSALVESPGPTTVGTRVTETRHVGGHDQQITYMITEHDPPRTFAFRGQDGPVRPIGKGTIEPLDDGKRSRVTIELDFEAHGLLGKMLLPMVPSQARKQVPKDQQRLKERLETTTP